MKGAFLTLGLRKAPFIAWIGRGSAGSQQIGVPR
jgi:hypothetical protein